MSVTQHDYIQTNDVPAFLAEHQEGTMTQNTEAAPASEIARQPLADAVRDFRHAFGLHVALEPNLAPRAALKLHHKLLAEEVGELHDAIVERDAEEVLDALGDIVYLAYGAALECGYDLDAALERIHAANMAKLRDGVVNRRADGKVLKPEGWKPPTMAGLV